MKAILIILLSFSLSASFAQMHFSIPVQELDSIAAMDSSAFRMHPIQLDVDVNQKSFDTYSINATTTFYENISGSTYYKAKNTQTVSVLELPSVAFDLKSAVNADKSYNVTKLNSILSLFSLKYRSTQ